MRSPNSSKDCICVKLSKEPALLAWKNCCLSKFLKLCIHYIAFAVQQCLIKRQINIFNLWGSRFHRNIMERIDVTEMWHYGPMGPARSVIEKFYSMSFQILFNKKCYACRCNACKVSVKV